MPQSTRILLVDCSRALDPEERDAYDVHHPPVGLLSLAARLDQAEIGAVTETKVVDSTIDYQSLDELREIMTDFAPHIVGLRCLHLHTEQFHTVTKMAKELPQPAITIGGGPYPSAAPLETMQKDAALDYLVVGEGEDVLLEFVEALRDGRELSAVSGLHYRDGDEIKTSLPRGVIQDLDAIPIPDWKRVDFSAYSKMMGQAPVLRAVAPIVTSRGCPYRCTYCHELFQKRFRVRSADNIVEELEVLHDLGVRDISIVDDIFNLYSDRVIDIFNQIIRRNLKFNFYYPNGLRGDRMEHETIDAMVEGGSVLFTYALESGSARIQKYMKKLLRFDEFYDAVDYTIKKGVMVDMFLMVGFPTETEEEAQKTLDFVMQWDEICFPILNVLNYFPGTEIYEQALAQGHGADILRLTEGYHQAGGLDPATIRTIKMRFLRYYFLRRSRLETIIPIQRKFLTDEELLAKYKDYLPMNLDGVDTIETLVETIALDTQRPDRRWVA